MSADAVTDHADTIRRDHYEALLDSTCGRMAQDVLTLLDQRDALLAEQQRLLDGAMRDATVHEAHRVEIERLQAERQQAIATIGGLRTKVDQLLAERAALLAERQQAQDKLWEQSEAAANLVVEVERLEAERRQAQEERDAALNEIRLRDDRDHLAYQSFREVKAQRQQAIDALREITEIPYRSPDDDAEKRIARAALEKLGETP